MTTRSESHLRLLFLSLLILFFVIPSSSFTLDEPVVGFVACLPRRIQAFKQFMSEFDTRGCNHSDNSNGVWCDNSTGVITKLQLTACLTGTLKSNSSLFKLHHLRYLDLSHNNFVSSSLPSEFGNLNKLKVLSLFSNGFSGQVPSSFNNLSRLLFLELSQNDLTGTFPHIWNLTKLSLLEISYNHFSGALNTNSGLFNLHHLRYLNLGNNDFSSSLPSEIGNLNKLYFLSLFSNDFLGEVPPTISNLTRLTELNLQQNQLTGSFPLVQNLTELSVLQLAYNSFSRNCPSSLLTMPSLSIIDLHGNHLTGSFEVPNSSTSSRLESLYLGYNHFEAQILEPISKLINLTALELSFLNISYPVDLSLFSSLKSLTSLDFSSSILYPASLSSSSYLPLTLKRLTLAECGISEFPNILKTLQNLESINLSGNMIKGKIPKWLWSLPRLSAVIIDNNYFNGFEGSPEVLVNSSLQVLVLDSNRFRGPLPNLPLSIQAIFVSDNKFTGEIPLSICNRSSLAFLLLSKNNFTGVIPPCLSNFTFVDLRKNNLEGSIPDVFGVCTSLTRLSVGFNRITGKLPRSLLNCSSLDILSVDNNNIEDTFPFWLKALPNLQIISLGSNKFHGPISPPHQGLFGFPKLQILEIADNKFTGNLSPSYFMDWKASLDDSMNEDGGLYMENQYVISGINYFFTHLMDLRYKGLQMEQERVLNSYRAIDFSGNLLEGDIPESIGLLHTLIALNLSNNAFTGHIPLSLVNLTELQSLDISRNQLSGTIPNGLGSLSFLAFVNVSYNQLKGEIPQGTQIIGQPKSSFEGNADLCGLPLEKKCFETSAPPTQHRKQEDEDDEQVLNWKGVAIGYGFGVLFGSVIAQVIVSYKPEWLAKIIDLNKQRSR